MSMTPFQLSDVDMFYMMSFLLSSSSWTLKIIHWVLEINFNQSYSRKICTSNFYDRQLEFLADVDVAR